MSIVPDSSNSSRGEVILNSPLPKVKKQISPAKRWCFTLNNYTDEEISSIVPIFDTKVSYGLFSKEVGEQGTPHLQGYLEFKTKCRPKSIGLPDRIHFEKCKGNRQQNTEYCSKDNDIVWSVGMPKPVKVIDPNYPWEQEILSVIKDEPDERKIYWYYGDGNKGKTSFCKYLTIKHKAICIGGKGADMRNAICDYVKTNNTTPELIVINIPRSHSMDYISYEGIENVKDMYFYSGKYEGGMVCGNPPHLFIFANESPEFSKLSEDRWVIKEI